ncbi:MAG: MoxR family ATPase [Ruminococcus sp.]|nr:MoxR family ATPase [Ruminococcus sp.]
MKNNLSPEQLNVLRLSQNVINEIEKVIIGKKEIIVKVLLSVLAGGHVLIEDIPGVGKTTLALALSKALSLDYKRLQFTPDVLPSDITGFSIYNQETHQFEYKPGAAITNLFLADEINRTSSKTQSALLEVMEEGKVTVDGKIYKMPEPYIVIATQNPIGSVGTQMLPESQMDRFIIRLTMGYPDLESEINMLKSKHNLINIDNLKSVATEQELIFAKREVEKVYASDVMFEYIAKLANATRNHPFIKLGLSPRGTIALLKMTKATALLRGRGFIVPDDVHYCFNDVSIHRIIFSSKSKINDMTNEDILKDIINSVPVPRVNQ